MRYKAVGLNCSAGTFLVGARKYFEILNNFQPNNFGLRTCSKVHSIPTSICSKDYAGIPDMSADVAFGNAETWEAVQTFVKYVLSKGIKIGILDVRGSFFASFESLFRELTELAFKEGYRSTYLSYASQSFDTGFMETRFTLIIHQKKHNFNISLPKIPETLRHIHDFIKDELYKSTPVVDPTATRYGPGSTYRLTYDEEICVPKIERGWTLKETISKRYCRLPGSAREFLLEVRDNEKYQDIRRCQWGMKLIHSNFSRVRYCHPAFDRLFTVGEMMKITGWIKSPVGRYPIEQMMYGTPAVIGEWLAKQARMWLRDKWKSKDYNLEYDHKEGLFKGSDANPFRPKKYINIMRYFNEEYVQEDLSVFPSKAPSTLDLDDDFYYY